MTMSVKNSTIYGRTHSSYPIRNLDEYLNLLFSKGNRCRAGFLYLGLQLLCAELGRGLRVSRLGPLFSTIRATCGIPEGS
jgi:hypothetical protein